MRWFILTFCLCFVLQTGWIQASEESLHSGRFGKVTLYRESPRPLHLVLFVSGDGGWNQGVVDMAKALASLDAVVAGIDITHYLRELRISPEACFLSCFRFRIAQQIDPEEIRFSDLRTADPCRLLLRGDPGLFGLGAGSSEHFSGCYQFGVLSRPPSDQASMPGQWIGMDPRAPRSGVQLSFLPQSPGPWIAFQGTIDQVCNANRRRELCETGKTGRDRPSAQGGSRICGAAKLDAPVQRGIQTSYQHAKDRSPFHHR